MADDTLNRTILAGDPAKIAGARKNLAKEKADDARFKEMDDKARAIADARQKALDNIAKCRLWRALRPVSGFEPPFSDWPV
jgi:hypothetical protein